MVAKDEKARKAYNQYMRNWRKSHSERAKSYRVKYWEKRADAGSDELEDVDPLRYLKAGCLGVMAKESKETGEKKSFFFLVLPDSRGYLWFYPFLNSPGEYPIIRKSQFNSASDTIEAEGSVYYILRLFDRLKSGVPLIDRVKFTSEPCIEIPTPHAKNRKVLYDRLGEEPIDF